MSTILSEVLETVPQYSLRTFDRLIPGFVSSWSHISASSRGISSSCPSLSSETLLTRRIYHMERVYYWHGIQYLCQLSQVILFILPLPSSQKPCQTGECILWRKLCSDTGSHISASSCKSLLHALPSPPKPCWQGEYIIWRECRTGTGSNISTSSCRSLLRALLSPLKPC